MAVVHFFREKLSNGAWDAVVLSEFRSLSGHSDLNIKGGIADTIAALGEWAKCSTCKEAGLSVDVALTGNGEVYHFIDGYWSRVAMLFSVSQSPQLQMEHIIVLKFALTHSALISKEDIAEAVDRLARWKQSQGT